MKSPSHILVVVGWRIGFFRDDVIRVFSRFGTIITIESWRDEGSHKFLLIEYPDPSCVDSAMEQKRRPDLLSLYDKLLYARCQDKRTPSIIVPPSLLLSYSSSIQSTNDPALSESIERQIAIYSPKMPIVYPLRVKGEAGRLYGTTKIEQELLTDVNLMRQRLVSGSRAASDHSRDLANLLYAYGALREIYAARAEKSNDQNTLQMNQIRMRAVTWDHSRLEAQYPPPIKKAYLVFGEKPDPPAEEPKSSSHTFAFPRTPRRASTLPGNDFISPPTSPSSFSYSPLIKDVTYWPEQGRAVWPPVVSNLRLLHGESGSEPSSPQNETQVRGRSPNISPLRSSNEAGRPGHLT